MLLSIQRNKKGFKLDTKLKAYTQNGSTKNWIHAFSTKYLQPCCLGPEIPPIPTLILQQFNYYSQFVPLFTLPFSSDATVLTPSTNSLASSASWRAGSVSGEEGLGLSLAGDDPLLLHKDTPHTASGYSTTTAELREFVLTMLCFTCCLLHTGWVSSALCGHSEDKIKQHILFIKVNQIKCQLFIRYN